MTPQVVVLGAGGHAKVVIETLEEDGRYRIAGCTSAGEAGLTLLGYPILGCDDVLPRLYQSGIEYAIAAIGDNAIRRRVSLWARELGFRLASAVSSRAAVSRRASLGEGTLVVRGAIVNAGATVGDGVIINTGATVDHDCVVGSYAHVAPGVHLAGHVHVGEGALVGVGACVLPGVRIGAWARVGAGAAVIADVPEGATAAGVPARILPSEQANG